MADPGAAQTGRLLMDRTFTSWGREGGCVECDMVFIEPSHSAGVVSKSVFGKLSSTLNKVAKIGAFADTNHISLEGGKIDNKLTGAGIGGKI